MYTLVGMIKSNFKSSGQAESTVSRKRKEAFCFS